MSKLCTFAEVFCWYLPNVPLFFSYRWLISLYEFLCDVECPVTGHVSSPKKKQLCGAGGNLASPVFTSLFIGYIFHSTLLHSKKGSWSNVEEKKNGTHIINTNDKGQELIFPSLQAGNPTGRSFPVYIHGTVSGIAKQWGQIWHLYRYSHTLMQCICFVFLQQILLIGSNRFLWSVLLHQLLLSLNFSSHIHFFFFRFTCYSAFNVHSTTVGGNSRDMTQEFFIFDLISIFKLQIKYS